MKKQIPQTFVFLLGFILSISLLTLPARALDQPRMQAAKSDLENAVKYLRRATADKGGHRERAIELASQSITAVNKGIDYDRTHITVRPRRNSHADSNNLLAISVLPDQPNMVTAKSYLNSALGNLNRASADKGGYREQAMSLIREAISEVDAGIEYDRTH